MIVVSAPVADALFGQTCDSECDGKGIVYFPDDRPGWPWKRCSGCASPSLSWLIVDGEPCPGPPYHGHYGPGKDACRGHRPPAISPGDRVEVWVKWEPPLCDICVEPHGWARPLLVGTVQVDRVLPIIGEGEWKAAPGVPDALTVSPGCPAVVFDPLLRRLDLSLYGDPSVLIGRYAVAVSHPERAK